MALRGGGLRVCRDAALCLGSSIADHVDWVRRHVLLAPAPLHDGMAALLHTAGCLPGFAAQIGRRTSAKSEGLERVYFPCVPITGKA